MTEKAVRIRRGEAPGSVKLTGYAATFTEYEVKGGPDKGGWIERIDRAVYVQALAKNPSVRLLLNMMVDPPLASTADGTLTLSVDDVGLRINAKLPGTPIYIPGNLNDEFSLAGGISGYTPHKLAGGPLQYGSLKGAELAVTFRIKDAYVSAAPGRNDATSYRHITDILLGDISVVTKVVEAKPL